MGVQGSCPIGINTSARVHPLKSYLTQLGARQRQNCGIWRGGWDGPDFTFLPRQSSGVLPGACGSGLLSSAIARPYASNPLHVLAVVCSRPTRFQRSICICQLNVTNYITGRSRACCWTLTIHQQRYSQSQEPAPCHGANKRMQSCASLAAGGCVMGSIYNVLVSLFARLSAKSINQRK